MRRFYSYGPVNCKDHFCVPRTEIIQKCADQLIGNIDREGHYFTLWAPRQTGKTWIMRQVKDEILRKYKDRFIIGTMSMQAIIVDNDRPDDIFQWIPLLINNTFKIDIDTPDNWSEWASLFHKKAGLFDRPVILFIDEFDKIPPNVIDRFVNLFRAMYLDRDSYLLHGLGLIGVRSVLGVESHRGSPFNVQRSLHIPNFSYNETAELFHQYIEESGQEIASEVIDNVYEATRGQPGLVCWFGELLTEKYNPGISHTIDNTLWQRVYNRALHLEWNNTILNLIKKARSEYQSYVMDLFASSEIPFSLDRQWCSYLYMNGIIDSELLVDNRGVEVYACRFSCPFVQKRLYNALTYDVIGEKTPIPPLDLLDTLEDVFQGSDLNLKVLLERYKDYLKRLKSKGLNPWKGQPRRADLHYTEAVGHFHLYMWLQRAIGNDCVISPEFPTGNGKVDLHLRCAEGEGIIEVKSFTRASDIKRFKNEAAKYAENLNKGSVTIALFVPTEEEHILEQFSFEEIINNVTVTVVAIGWTV